MTINHLNLIVSNVNDAVKFFEDYFGFYCELVKGEDVVAVLKNEEDFTLVIMSNKNGDITYPKGFHIGFMINSIEEVDILHKKLVDGKIEITQPPRKIRNSYAFYFYFDNLFIEIGHYLN